MNATAIFLTAFVFSLYLVVPAGTWLMHRRLIARDPMARLWYGGAVFQAMVVLLIGTRPVLPEWAGFHLVAVLAVGSMGLMLEAIRRELELAPVRPSWAFGILAAWGLGFSLLYAARADGTLGIAAMSGALALLDVWIMRLLWRLRQRTRQASLLAMMFALVLAAIGHLTRGVIAVEGRVPFDPRTLEPWTAFIVTCWVLSFMLLYVGGLGYLLEKSQARLRDSLLREQAAEHERQRAQDDLQRRDELLMDGSRLAAVSATSLYVSSIVHEISQPLQTLSLSLESMVRQAKSFPLPESMARDLQEMVDVHGQAGAVVATLRSMLAHGRLTPEPVDVAVALREVLRVAQAQAERVGVAFTTQIEPAGGLFALCDRIMIQRIVFNLVANALQELRDAGPPACMRVTLGRNATPAGQWVELCVSDSGRGLPPQVAASLHEGWSSTKATGMGLGLKLTRELMAQWGGQMHVEPAWLGERAGTRVRLMLACAPSA